MEYCESQMSTFFCLWPDVLFKVSLHVFTPSLSWSLTLLCIFPMLKSNEDVFRSWPHTLSPRWPRYRANKGVWKKQHSSTTCMEDVFFLILSKLLQAACFSFLTWATRNTAPDNSTRPKLDVWHNQPRNQIRDDRRFDWKKRSLKHGIKRRDFHHQWCKRMKWWARKQQITS